MPAADTARMVDIHQTRYPDGFDIAWKHLLEEMLPDFLGFYFPSVAGCIDWRPGDARTERPWVFLSQELQQIHPQGGTGHRTVDRLVEVTLRGGRRQVLYIHIEVQSQPDPEFPERMFIYHYRIYDRFRRPVSSMAVLGDRHRSWRPDGFSLQAPGMVHRLRWPTVKLLDYAGREAELATSPNPFAWVTLAHLATLRTRNRPDRRVRAKRELIRLAVSNGWERPRIISLLRALDFMMRLPPEADHALWRELHEQGDVTVELLCDWELGFIEQGRLAGREEGRAAEAALIRHQLERRFGPLPDDVTRRVEAGSFEELERWGLRLLDADSLARVFAG